MAALMLAGCTANLPPSLPVISGETLGRTGVRERFTVSAEDPEEDDVFFAVDWGDGTPTEEWLGPASSDSSMAISHAFTDTGTFGIRAKARDRLGAESDWTAPYEFTVIESEYPLARDFALPDLDGDTIRLYPLLADGPVFLVWWDLPCVNSIAELDSLQTVYDSLSARGLEILALSVDRSEYEAQLRAFVETRSWTFPVLLDSQQTTRERYGVIIKPTSVLVSQDTAIVYTHIGWRAGDLDLIVARILEWLP